MIRCLNCGQDFTPTQGKQKYCTRKCWFDNNYRVNSLDYSWRLKKLLAMAKNRAKEQKIPFEIDHEYLLSLWDYQDGRCDISGQLFELITPEQYSCNPLSPSIDKIIPKLGYVKGNIRLVCYQVNTALNEYGKDWLIRMCKLILENNGVQFR